MKPTSITIELLLLMASLMTLAPEGARADGSLVRLHETHGPFSVTVFASPETVTGGFTDVSVLVQSRKDGDMVLDANVSLSVTPPEGITKTESDPICGPSSHGVSFGAVDVGPYPLIVRATREQASNKLLYAAPLKLSAPGKWPLQVIVSRGADEARFDCLLPVTTPSSQVSRLWPYLAFPPLAVVAFALNQKLRRSSLEKGAATIQSRICPS